MVVHHFELRLFSYDLPACAQEEKEGMTRARTCTRRGSGGPSIDLGKGSMMCMHAHCGRLHTHGYHTGTTKMTVLDADNSCLEYGNGLVVSLLVGSVRQLVNWVTLITQDVRHRPLDALEGVQQQQGGGLICRGCSVRPQVRGG